VVGIVKTEGREAEGDGDASAEREVGCLGGEVENGDGMGNFEGEKDIVEDFGGEELKEDSVKR